MYLAKARFMVVLSTGHQKVILQSDQEPSIIDVKHNAINHIQTEIAYQEYAQLDTATSPAASSSSSWQPFHLHFFHALHIRSELIPRVQRWTGISCSSIVSEPLRCHDCQSTSGLRAPSPFDSAQASRGKVIEQRQRPKPREWKSRGKDARPSQISMTVT